jgi:hypothetical protein
MGENCLCGALGALVDVGLGKTATWRQRIAAGLVKKELTAVLAVPRHRLGDEVVRDLVADGVIGKVYRGREADDPEQPGAKMCQDLERAKLIEGALGDVGTHACQRADYKCKFFAVCGYQRQRR